MKPQVPLELPVIEVNAVASDGIYEVCRVPTVVARCRVPYACQSTQTRITDSQGNRIESPSGTRSANVTVYESPEEIDLLIFAAENPTLPPDQSIFG